MTAIQIRKFRAQLAELIDQKEPVVITKHGRAVAVLYPIKDAPADIRREVANGLAADLGLATDEVVERYKDDVDRTLIRENLRRTPAERLQSLQEMQRLRDELRR